MFEVIVLIIGCRNSMSLSKKYVHFKTKEGKLEGVELAQTPLIGRGGVLNASPGLFEDRKQFLKI